MSLLLYMFFLNAQFLPEASIIDQKNIIAYCNPCKTNALESTISFSSRSDELIEVIIEYLKPTESKAMPLFNDPNLVKRETWIVDTKGFFILKE